jgi:hypothetical protein
MEPGGAHLDSTLIPNTHELQVDAMELALSAANYLSPISNALVYLNTTKVHPVWFPYPLAPTLHALRVSMVFQSQARRSTTPHSWGTYLTGFLITVRNIHTLKGEVRFIFTIHRHGEEAFFHTSCLVFPRPCCIPSTHPSIISQSICLLRSFSRFSLMQVSPVAQKLR